MVIAPARGVKIIGKDVREIARERLESLGMEVVFAPNSVDENWDYMGSSSVEKRVSDIHTAFADQSVKSIVPSSAALIPTSFCRIWIMSLFVKIRKYSAAFPILPRWKTPFSPKPDW